MLASYSTVICCLQERSLEKEKEAASSLLKAAKAAGAERLEEETKAEAIR